MGHNPTQVLVIFSAQLSAEHLTTQYRVKSSAYELSNQLHSLTHVPVEFCLYMVGSGQSNTHALVG